MDLLGSSLVLYLMIGAAVACAVYVAGPSASLLERCFQSATAVLFWPLYVPGLLQGGRRPAAPHEPDAQDELGVAIAQAECELQAAFAGMRGWAEEVLSREKERLGELHSAWSAQAQRIREMDRILALHPHSARRVDADADSRLQQSEQARQGNLDRLRALRRQAHEDLTASLAAVRELVSMIHLAKFTGAPASRAEEIVAQIAATVEGLSLASGPMELAEAEAELGKR